MALCTLSPSITRATVHFNVSGPVRTPVCDLYTTAISVSQTFSIYLHLLTLPKTTSVISFNCGNVKEKSPTIRLPGLCILYASAACYIQECFHDCC